MISQLALQLRVESYLMWFWSETKAAVTGWGFQELSSKKKWCGGSHPLSQKSTSEMKLVCTVTHFGVMNAAFLANTSERDLGERAHVLFNSWVRNLINGVTKYQWNPRYWKNTFLCQIHSFPVNTFNSEEQDPSSLPVSSEGTTQATNAKHTSYGLTQNWLRSQLHELRGSTSSLQALSSALVTMTVPTLQDPMKQNSRFEEYSIVLKH